MTNQRQQQRRTLAEPKKLVMIFIPFQTKEKRDIAVDVVDESPGGMGINSDCELQPGFVEIRGFMGEDREGVIAWTRKEGDASFRAGVHIVQSRPAVEEHRSDQDVMPPELRPPGFVASMLVDEIVSVQDWKMWDQ